VTQPRSTFSTFSEHLAGPLRIAFVLTLDRGGPVELSVQLAAELAGRDDVELRLFAPAPARGGDQVADLLEDSQVGPHGAASAISAARRRIIAWGPHVVHAQDRRAGLVCAGLRRPVVLTYHGVPDDVPPAWLTDGTVPGPSRYTKGVLSADAAMARAVNRTVVAAPSMADFLIHRLRVPERKVVHIDNGVRLPAAQPADVRPIETHPKPRTVRRLLFVGPLVPRKGVHLLLEALADPRLPADLTLQLAGDGPERAALEDQARRAGLAERVRFLGFRTEVPQLLAEADAFVLPSLLEQQPLALTEAMAAGLPCLATDVGGVADQLGPDGVVVAAGSAAALADGLLALLEPDAADLGRRAAQRARERFSLADCARRHLELYNAL
jgi:glycosyltransferase involved in cell wall biosynthesis